MKFLWRPEVLGVFSQNLKPKTQNPSFSNSRRLQDLGEQVRPPLGLQVDAVRQLFLLDLLDQAAGGFNPQG